MPRTLLLADDSVVIQKLVGLSFANEDVELITVDNGDDAVLQARAARPDLVLADVVMPGRSGYEVCEAIKQTPEIANTPVLLLTGTFEAFDEERATRVGANGHITKPFEAQVLVDRVKAVLAAAPAAATASVSAPSSPDLAIGSGDVFDFFDETSDGSTAIAAAPDSQTPPIQAEPLAEIALPAPPAAPILNADPIDASDDSGATMLVDDLFEDGDVPAAADPSDSIPDITPPGPDEYPIRPPALSGVDLFGDDVAVDTTPDLDTGNNSGPLDLDLSLGGLDLSRDGTSAPDATVAILPPAETTAPVDSDPLAALAASVDREVLLETPAPEPTEPLAPAALVTEPPNFEDSRPPPNETRPVSTGIRDDRFDISSSDLDDAMAVRAPEVATPLPELSIDATEPIATVTLEEEPVDGEPISVVQPIDEPFASPEPMAIFAEPEPTQSAPPPAPALPPEPEPTLEAAPEPAFVAPDETQPALQDAPQTAPFAGAAPEISAEMRQQIQEALEKVAWEAFSDVSQTIVRQALEQVERIAWEVIPQMAERLIQEEIRRLKGGDGS